MKKRHHWIAEPLLAALAAFAALFSLALVLAMLSVGKTAFAIFFAVILLFFFVIAAFYGSLITLDEHGLTQRILFFPVRRFRWEDVGELGICGSRAFHKKHPDRAGILYFYISPNSLSEEERFRMVLQWPPLELCFFRFSQRRLEKLQLLVSRELVTYNVGAFSIGSWIQG